MLLYIFMIIERTNEVARILKHIDEPARTAPSLRNMCGRRARSEAREVDLNSKWAYDGRRTGEGNDAVSAIGWSVASMHRGRFLYYWIGASEGGGNCLDH